MRVHATPVPMLSWVWQERRALREQQRAVEAAEEARRKLVTVTFDLLGRQVGVAGVASHLHTSTCSTCGPVSHSSRM